MQNSIQRRKLYQKYHNDIHIFLLQRINLKTRDLSEPSLIIYDLRLEKSGQITNIDQVVDELIENADLLKKIFNFKF